jgi:predicted nucleotidyltransferase
MIKFAKYILAQGILYMEWPERIVKASVTILLFFVLVQSTNLHLITCALLAHLLNFILFSQFFVLVRHNFDNGILTRKKLYQMMNILNLVSMSNSVVNVFFLGSLVRNDIKPSSDIDVRVQVNSLHAAFYVSIAIMCLRFYANLRGLPIDIYVFKDVRFLTKIRTDELIWAIKNVEFPIHRPYKVMSASDIEQAGAVLR